MSLQSQLSTLAVRLGTEFKAVYAKVGTLGSLTTTDKTNLVAAINEVKAGSSGAPPAASESTAGVAELATTTETTTGTDDARIVTPLKLVQKLTAWAQPLSSNLTTLAGVASGAFGRTLLGSADAAAAKTSLGLSAVASSGSASDITTGTLPTSVLPPLAINDTFTVASQAAMLALTAERGDIAIRTDLGRNFVLTADAPGTLANWVQLLGGSDVASVAGRTGAVVLTKSDVGLGNVDNTSDVNKPVSTAQATADGLNLKIANNFSDLNNPTTARSNLGLGTAAVAATGDFDAAGAATTAAASAQAAAIAASLQKSANLSDVGSAATSRTNLSVFSQAEIGSITTDFVAVFEAALV